MTATTPASTAASLGAHHAGRRPDIQGLRAVAVLSVIAFHADLPVPGGFTGVDIFFVISGFVITQLILREHAAGTFRFGRFYARRAQRLLPALALMIVIVFVISLLVQSPFGAMQLTAQTGIGAMFLIANAVIVRTVGDYFAPGAESNPLLNTWSLSVEEQFYLLFPLLVILGLGASIAPRLRRAALTVGALTVLSFVIGFAWTYARTAFDVTTQPEAWAFYLSPARAWEFGIGALLALAITSGRALPRTAALPAAVTGVLLLAVGFWAIGPATPFPGYAALAPVLGTALLIAAGSHVNPVSRALSTAPMVRVGDWSYSLYLWHWPLIVFAVLLWPGPWTPLLAAAVSFIPALMSYHLVEDPIRGRRMSGRHVTAWSVTTVALVTALGVLLATLGPRIIPGIGDLNQQRLTPNASDAANCFTLDRFTPDMMQRCWFRTEGAQGWVLLAGDSHASHLSNAVIGAAHARDLDVFSVTGGVCPFLVTPAGASDVDNCDEMNRAVWDLVTGEAPPAAVVLGEKGIASGTAATIQAIEDRGIPVILSRDVPRWAPLDRRIQSLPCSGGVLTFTCDFTAAQVDAFDADTRQVEDELIAANPDLITVDPYPYFCSETECSPIQDNSLMYIDNEHLNGLGSSRLTPLFTQALEHALGTG
jgi:peptidoglycan/LPS O-acetylase OafA/YrhL